MTPSVRTLQGSKTKGFQGSTPLCPRGSNTRGFSTRIQYATQQYFFGVMAEKYFDDMNNDVQTTGKRHQQKSVDGFNSLPDVFTSEDVKRCFGYTNTNSINSKIRRLVESRHAEKITKGKEKGKYKKKAQMYQ